jgi:hypothetical protein
LRRKTKKLNFKMNNNILKTEEKIIKQLKKN